MRYPATIVLIAATLASAGLVNFDSYPSLRLNLVNASFGANRGLYYEGLGIANIFDNGHPLQAVNPLSAPNVLAYGDLERLSDHYPYITSKYQGSQGTLDLESFYYGCVVGNSAANCTILIAGYKDSNLVAGQTFDFRPPVSQGASMVQLRLDSTWRGIDGIRFLTTFIDRATHPELGGATFLDDIRYTYFA